MAIDLQGQAGPQTLSDGAKALLRQGRTGELIAGLIGARYREAVLRGNVYHASVGSAGVAPGTALGTTAAFTLYNPAGSGKNLVILQASLAYISGTLGAGAVVYAANSNPIAAAVTGTGLTEVNGLVGSGNTPVGQAMHTATLPATPTIVRPFCSLTALLATTAVEPYTVIDDVDGALAIAPGCAVSLEAIAAAGTTPLVLFGMTWEEVPV